MIAARGSGFVGAHHRRMGWPARATRVLPGRSVYVLMALLATLPAGAEELPRIGSLGARVSASGKPGEGAAIRRIVEMSEAQRMGLTTSDNILTLNGRAIDTDFDVENFFDRQPANSRVTLEVLRNGERIKLESTLPPLPRENFEGVAYTYDFVVNNKGQRLRTIMTRPAQAKGKVAAVLVVGWLSCDSCEYPDGARGGMDKLLAWLVKDSGYAVLRMDKPGVGDSEGVCAEADFESEITGYRAAFASLEKYPFIDRERVAVVGLSNGGGFAPLAAPAGQVKGYLAVGSWGRTWYEHMLAIERERRVANGIEPGKIDSELKLVADFYALYLSGKKTPKEILATHPDLRAIWEDGDVTQYGRPAAFYQQLQELNLGAAWSAVKAPVLVLRGEYDWIMPREDGSAIVASVNRNQAGVARYVELPRVGHGLTQFESLSASTKGGGEYYQPVEGLAAEFLRSVFK